MKATRSDDFDQWVSLSTITGWVWQNVLSRPGAILLGICALLISILVALKIKNPWLAIPYLPLAIIGLYFLVFIAGLIAFTGDIFAGWAIQKLFVLPNPRNPWHRCVYLVLSGISFLVAGAFILPQFIGP